MRVKIGFKVLILFFFSSQVKKPPKNEKDVLPQTENNTVTESLPGLEIGSKSLATIVESETEVQFDGDEEEKSSLTEDENICTDCDKHFITISKLEAHIKAMHSSPAVPCEKPSSRKKRACVQRNLVSEVLTIFILYNIYNFFVLGISG